MQVRTWFWRSWQKTRDYWISVKWYRLSHSVQSDRTVRFLCRSIGFSFHRMGQIQKPKWLRHTVGCVTEACPEDYGFWTFYVGLQAYLNCSSKTVVSMLNNNMIYSVEEELSFFSQVMARQELLKWQYRSTSLIEIV